MALWCISSHVRLVCNAAGSSVYTMRLHDFRNRSTRLDAIFSVGSLLLVRQALTFPSTSTVVYAPFSMLGISMRPFDVLALIPEPFDRSTQRLPPPAGSLAVFALFATSGMSLCQFSGICLASDTGQRSCPPSRTSSTRVRACTTPNSLFINCCSTCSAHPSCPSMHPFDF